MVASAKTGPPAIQIEGLVKRYGALSALRGISFEVQEGEFFGLLGPNGAGKSTAINIIVGLTRRSEGKVSVFGHDVTADYRTTRRLVGVVPQELVFDHFFTVERTLKIQSGYFGVTGNEDWLEHLMEVLDLAAHRKKKVLELSGGMKRRLLVAKALVHRPRVLILDEPTAGVDVSLRRSLWEFVREIHDQGTTVLLTTHYIEEAEQHCQRIGILNHGAFVALDRTEKLVRTLDEKRISLYLSDPLSDLPPRLQPFKGVLGEGGRKLTFPLSREDGNLRALLHAVTESGLGVADLEVHMPDLEDVFVTLTSRSVREEGGPSTGR